MKWKLVQLCIPAVVLVYICLWKITFHLDENAQPASLAFPFRNAKEEQGNSTLKAVNYSDEHSSIACSFGDGRLGNQMSSFATLYSLGKKFGLKVFVTKPQLNILHKFFKPDGLTTYIQVLYDFDKHWNSRKWINLFEIKTPTGVHYDYTNQTMWETVKKGKFLDIGKYPNDLSSFKSKLPDLKNIFKLKNSLVNEAQRRLKIIGNDYILKWSLPNLTELTFISVHVRRTDYAYHLNYWYKLAYVKEQYFQKAMKYYKDQFNNVIFYLVSDDSEWAENYAKKSPGNTTYYDGTRRPSDSEFAERPPIFGHPKLTPDENIGVDMALLSLANHSILTYGTFGMWGALLAGGQATLPGSHISSKESTEIVAANISEWIFI